MPKFLIKIFIAINSAIKLPIDIYDTDEYRNVLKSYAEIIKNTISKHLVK